jgi:biopolymer transport protein TolQ
MNGSLHILAFSEFVSSWAKASPGGQLIICILAIFSVFAWSIMAYKAMQMRRAKRLNHYFDLEFHESPKVLSIYDRKVDVEGCPLFTVYEAGCDELNERLKGDDEESRKQQISLKGMEHVKSTLERCVAKESLKLEGGIILLANAVSGAPFLGLLGTVWGVLNVFQGVSESNQADLVSMAPGLAAAMLTTVAGLLVAIPSMFGYNWLVHTLRVLTVELDNFAQELASRMETEFLRDDGSEAESSIKKQVEYEI